MHEASLALSIIDLAVRQCQQEGYSTINSIEVEVGSASGVLSDALLMAFDIIKLDTPAVAGARLIINEVPLGGTCRSCHKDFSTQEQFMLECPNCGGKDFQFLTGRELNIKEIDVS